MTVSRYADQPAVSTIIAGVTRPDQLRSNVDAAGLDPVEPALAEELKGWYEDKVQRVRTTTAYDRFR